MKYYAIFDPVTDKIRPSLIYEDLASARYGLKAMRKSQFSFTYDVCYIVELQITKSLK